MAYTKVFAIRSRLDKSVAYAANEKKTGLSGMVEYAVNHSKTESRLFESAINCQSPESAYKEMCATKERWHKPGGVLGYHFIQAFSPGEVTPEQAHAIGVEFANRLFGGRFEVVIGTHLDREHLHNHIIINSVSCTDGLKYHSSPDSYYNNVRGLSDGLCRENELSVITPRGKGRHYAEWEAEKQGKPTVRGIIRRDIDDILSGSFTYKTFLEQLRKRGYTVKTGPNVKHTAIRPPGGERFIRLDSLGSGYMEDAIKERLAGIRMDPPRQKASAQTPLQRRVYRFQGSFSAHKPIKLKGLRALYFKYLYLLGAVPKRQARREIPFALKREVIKLERYKRQFQFLNDNRIDSTDELSMLTDAIEARIYALTEQRRELYIERRSGNETASSAIAALNEELRKQRKALRMCGAIQADIPKIKAIYNMGGRDTHSKNRSDTHEKTYKARPYDSFIPHSGIPSESQKQH